LWPNIENNKIRGIMRISANLPLIIILGMYCSILPALAQSEKVDGAKIVSEIIQYFPQQRVEVYGQLAEISRDDLKQLVEVKKDEDTPRKGRTWDSAIIKDNFGETLLSWAKQNRANIKDISYLTVARNQAAHLCFVETTTISLPASVIAKGQVSKAPTTSTTITKRYIDILPFVEHDGTITVEIRPGLTTTVPPPLDATVNSQSMSLVVNMKNNETLAWGDFGDSKTPRVSLFFFTVRAAELRPFGK
jgi:hypothetical protein